MTLRLRILSDLHVDFNKGAPKDIFADVDFDALIVAGDIREGCARSMRWLEEDWDWRDKPIVFVPGNHEFYGQIMQDDLAEARSVAEASQGRVHLLSPGSAVIEANGVSLRIVGATLWTDYDLYGAGFSARGVAARDLNDHHEIRLRRGDGAVALFSPEDAAALHAAELAFLKTELAKPHACPTIVVTHHAPSEASIDAQYRGETLSAAFAGNLNAVVEASGAALWIHGHVHHSCDYRLGATRVLCNPVGYRFGKGRYENLRFAPCLTVEVTG